MARTLTGAAQHKKRKALIKKAKGYFGARSKCRKTVKGAVTKAEQYATRDRRKKKGDFRRLWITRISAAVRNEGMTYSRFINGLKRAEITLDRRTLSELAIHNPEAFCDVVKQAKAALEAN